MATPAWTRAQARIRDLGCARAWSYRRHTATSSTSPPKPDILIIGSGGAALTAALRAKHLGLEPLVVEKTPRIGGSTCYSGGGLWIPGNSLPDRRGEPDSIQDALKYMETLIGDVGPASSRERKMAFLENGPKMVRFLQDQGFRWVSSTGYPDYYPKLAGGRAGGRSIEPDFFDMMELPMVWREKLNLNPVLKTTIPMRTFEGAKMFRAGSSMDGLSKALQVLAVRKGMDILRGRWRLGMGASLISQLLNQCLLRKIPVWTDAPMRSLIDDGKGTVTGAVISKDGKDIPIEAGKAVLLAAGGFARNASMRRKYQEAPITVEWSSTPPDDTGDAVTAAVDIGAATALMDDAWWGPTYVNPTTKVAMWCQFERALPHSIVVDSAGHRFTNEAQSYTTFVHDQYKRNRKTSAVPAFMIMDSQFRKRYLMGGAAPGSKPPKKEVEQGLVVVADTLPELAAKLGVNAQGLKEEVARFNIFVKNGTDVEFSRGDSPYDTFFGDPALTYKNPNLGAIEKGPFYGIMIWPGDLGTKGGVLTDEYARVLKEDGSVIENLYAVGNTSASVMGREYAGAGSTLGPALTYAYVAVNHVAKGGKAAG